MLKPAGWLVLNCWTEHRADPFLLSVLKQRFEMVYVCSTVSGNWIILAGLEKSGLSQNELKDKALKLSQQFGFSFTPHLKRLSPQN
jgi:spermidine synthase